MKRLGMIATALLATGCRDTMPASVETDSLAVEVMRMLSDDAMQGRGAGTEGARMAHDYLVETLEGLGCLDVQSQPFTFGEDGETGRNIGAVLERSGDLGLVIMAHYDHLGVRDGVVFNGADDNASGVGAAVAIAESVCARAPEHTVVFLLTDAEERGLAGARALMENYSGERLFVMNLDMVAQNADGVIYASGTRHHPEVRTLLESMTFEGVDLRFGHDDPTDPANDWTTMSDHAPFHARGLPYVYFGVEDHPHYHQPTDTFETVPVAQYLRFVDMLEEVARALDANLEELAGVATAP